MEKFTCDCGTELKSARAKHLHERGNAHKAWASTQPRDGMLGETDVPTGITCEICGAGPFLSVQAVTTHTQGDCGAARRQERAKATRQMEEAAAERRGEGLPADLRAAVTQVHLSPQDRAKIVRGGFSARSWPNAEHPGTVRDFLIDHDIPIAPDVSRLATVA